MAAKKDGKTKSKKGSKQGKKTSMATKSVVAICNKVVSRTEEKKVLNYTIPSNAVCSAYGGTIWTTQTGLWALSPYTGYLDCVQGVSQNQRIGNRITIQKAVLKLMFNPFPYDIAFNPTPGPLEVSVILFCQRQDSTNLPSALPGFYQNGATSDSPSLTGLLYDTMKPFNNDRWRVFKRKTFKLGFSSYNGTGSSAALQSVNNNDFKLNQRLTIDYTKYLNKTVKYDDTTVNPLTRGLFMTILVHTADGRPLSNTGKYCYVNGGFQMTYTDA